ncbi:hypothetical protein MKW94_005995 [Papaver nudicaule]|uniref:Copine C-terminal domain-containing protein n=1 Tax=Papaver nudicaule TaxID=74823 RepID=A0AA41V5Z4_PAPNU|nr:hypothetical protein [Papaver nudicaule]
MLVFPPLSIPYLMIWCFIQSSDQHLILIDKLHMFIIQMGVGSVNLIVGVCFTKREGSAVHSLTETTLHHIDTENPIHPNKYEKVIWITAKLIKDLNGDNSIRCFGFGDGIAFSSLLKKVSYDVIIRKAICLASETSDRHHVLVIIASEPVSRSSDTRRGLSDEEQRTLDAIAIARNYRLSIVLVSVGETNQNMMRELRKKIPSSDYVTVRMQQCYFVDYTRIMLTDKPLQTRNRDFCLAVFGNLPREIPERLHALIR